MAAFSKRLLDAAAAASKRVPLCRAYWGLIAYSLREAQYNLPAPTCSVCQWMPGVYQVWHVQQINNLGVQLFAPTAPLFTM